MILELHRARSALDGLPIASDPTFRRVLLGGRLRCEGVDGTPDEIDELSARLACSVLRAPQSKRTGSLLLVFPDDDERRPALLFASALIMDALASIEAARAGRLVLHVGVKAGIRTQLGRVRIGGLSLESVFAHQYERGGVDGPRTLALSGGVHLPAVLSVSSPADPTKLIQEFKPKWVAVDSSDSYDSGWLTPLLQEATRLGIPTIGWTSSPFGGTVSQWLAADRGVFRWPRLRSGRGDRSVTFDSIPQHLLKADIQPRLLSGSNVLELSRAFASAAEALISARNWQDGRLSTDAIAVGWKYLRSLESLPVPMEVWERSAGSYWGTHRPSELKRAFERFIEALASAPSLQSALRTAAEALAGAEVLLGTADSPLWLGLANLCIDSDASRRILFSSRARREIFAFTLLSRFNISEDDLQEIGVSLESVGVSTPRPTAQVESDLTSQMSTEPTPLLVGLPTHAIERHFDRLVDGGRLEVLVWPHQVGILARRVSSIARELDLSSFRLGWLHPDLADRDDVSSGAPNTHRLVVCSPRFTLAEALEDELRSKLTTVALWKRPEVVETIANLFATPDAADDDETYTGRSLPEYADGQTSEEQASDDLWVAEAIALHFDDGRSVLLPSDETLNIVVSGRDGVEIEPRYVRAVRPGDEVLFIQGQRRQSLYDLLVSRVHRDPVIGQYLALARRWQDDLARAFGEAERRSNLTVDKVLEQLQSRGSGLTSPQTIRTWLRRMVLAPNDADDLRRVAEIFSLRFVAEYFRQIHRAGRRLKGLHISLSARLNRWLASGAVGAVAAGDPADGLIDEELGLTLDDFRHSLLRLRVRDATRERGPFYKPQLGQLEGGVP